MLQWNPVELFKPQYPHAYSPHCSPYVSYVTSWENLIKHQHIHVWRSFPLNSHDLYVL